MSVSLTAFAIESWLLYAVAVLSIFLRIVSRRMSLGAFSKFQSDDYIMIFVVSTFTASIICANQIVNEERTQNFSQDVAPGILGNTVWALKMKFALEQFQLATVWLVKASLIIMFRRIFHHTRERQFILGTAVLCASSYTLIQILLLGVWCRPIQRYWSPDPKHINCPTYQPHSLLTLSLSVTTTLLTSILPIPFIPTPRSILLALLTGLGTLILILSILARTYMLTSPLKPTYLYLYAAESAISITTYNIPFLFTLTSSHHRRTYNPHTPQTSHVRLPPTPPPTLASIPPSRVPTISLRDKPSHLSLSLRDKPSTHSLSTLTNSHTSPTHTPTPQSPQNPTLAYQYPKPTKPQTLLSLATTHYRQLHISSSTNPSPTHSHRTSCSSVPHSPITTPCSYPYPCQSLHQHCLPQSHSRKAIDSPDDGWDTIIPPGTTTPVPTLRPTDPPLELEGYLREMSRRGSERSARREYVGVGVGY